MPLLPGMLRPEQSGVAGCNVTASEINWTCHKCTLIVTVERVFSQQLGYVDKMPGGWVHALVQQPGVNRISLLCRFCAEGMTVAELADQQKAEHEAWIAEEKAWIAAQLGSETAALEAQRLAIEVKLAAMRAEEQQAKAEAEGINGHG